MFFFSIDNSLSPPKINDNNGCEYCLFLSFHAYVLDNNMPNVILKIDSYLFINCAKI